MRRRTGRITVAVSTLAIPVVIATTAPASEAAPKTVAPRVAHLSTTTGSTLGGTKVTLTGTGFSGATGVTFGTTKAKFHVVSAKKIVVTAPRHASATVDVRVTTRLGTSHVVKVDKFRFGPPPTVSKLSAQTGPAQGGSTITVTGTNLSHTLTVTFGRAKAHFHVVSAHKLTVTTPAHPAGKVPVSVLTQYGTSRSTKATLYTYTGVITPTTPPTTPPPTSPVPSGAGTVSGLVTFGGTPEAAATVTLSPLSGTVPPTFAITGADGRYSATGIPAGSYSVCFDPNDATAAVAASQCYANKPASGAVDPTVVTVAAGKVTPGIDAILEGAGGITGSATTAGTGSPLAGIAVQAISTADQDLAYYATTQADGTFALSGMVAGVYAVCWIPTDGGSAHVAGQCYRGMSLLTTSPDGVAVTAGAVTPHIDATLTPSASISGHVGTAGGAGDAAGAQVTLTGSSAETRYAVADASGDFTLDDLDAGSYTVCAYPNGGDTSNAVARCFGDTPADSPELATTVTVSTGQARTGVDLSFGGSGAISGTVLAADTGTGLAQVDVSILDNSGTTDQTDVTTAADGTYTAAGLSAGDYTVCFTPSESGYISECFRDQTPGQGSPTAVTVTEGATASGIDATLAAGGSISGTVTAQAGSSPVAGVRVEITGSDAGTTSYATTGGNGTYSAVGLPAGNYTVCFFASGGIAGGCYDHEPSGSPTTVTLTAGEAATGIDGQLASAGSISGTVTDAGTAAPLAEVEVDAFPVGSAGTQQTTDTRADGTYSLSGLADGDYTVCFYPNDPYQQQCYDGTPAGSGQPQPLTITAGTPATGIDAQLATS